MLQQSILGWRVEDTQHWAHTASINASECYIPLGCLRWHIHQSQTKNHPFIINQIRLQTNQMKFKFNLHGFMDIILKVTPDLKKDRAARAVKTNPPPVYWKLWLRYDRSLTERASRVSRFRKASAMTTVVATAALEKIWGLTSVSEMASLLLLTRNASRDPVARAFQR